MTRLLASWFGTGLILGGFRGSHNGSGTVAGALTFPLALGIGARWGWELQLTAAAVVALVGFWPVRELFAEEGDAGWIVIDEAAGTMLAVAGLGVGAAVVAFLVFRVADIFKVPGVGAADRLAGSAGVMLDDLVAGAYGLAAGHLLQALL
ncbi:MAG: phosphatidylglycerophosphatase A [Actinobacteria bacterium]|nr:phosphatidylglycerophosphatase A [Actinomycetota bacterium]